MIRELSYISNNDNNRTTVSSPIWDLDEVDFLSLLLPSYVYKL